MKKRKFVPFFCISFFFETMSGLPARNSRSSSTILKDRDIHSNHYDLPPTNSGDEEEYPDIKPTRSFSDPNLAVTRPSLSIDSHADKVSEKEPKLKPFSKTPVPMTTTGASTGTGIGEAQSPRMDDKKVPACEVCELKFSKLRRRQHTCRRW